MQVDATNTKSTNAEHTESSIPQIAYPDEDGHRPPTNLAQAGDIQQIEQIADDLISNVINNYVDESNTDSNRDVPDDAQKDKPSDVLTNQGPTDAPNESTDDSSETQHNAPPDGQANRPEQPPLADPHPQIVTQVSDNAENQKRSVIDKARASEKKKDDEKLGIYKALAIKLKKELVKSRDEHQRYLDSSTTRCAELQKQLDDLSHTLSTERQLHDTTTSALESRIAELKDQLQRSESDLLSLQKEFDNYKTRASQIMQSSTTNRDYANKTFEEERYIQLRSLNETQTKRITKLEEQLSAITSKNEDLQAELTALRDGLDRNISDQCSIESLESKCDKLTRENDNLKATLAKYRSKLQRDDSIVDFVEIPSSYIESKSDSTSTKQEQVSEVSAAIETSRSSPGSAREYSSEGGSSSGYVHVKPASNTFEIVNNQSAQEDLQGQLESLTKAYLDSENTNSLLTDQVRALKDEIRRMQRGNERLDLAQNLEYLKNVVLKFVTLDSSQVEQKQRLIPVLSTVLKLDPDETAKLQAISTQHEGLTTSFFKF